MSFEHFYDVKLRNTASMLKKYKVQNAKDGSDIVQEALYEILNFYDFRPFLVIWLG